MKRGSKIETSKFVNCHKCTLKDKCKDERKSRNFACSFFVEDGATNPSDKRWATYLQSLAESESIVADRWQIDDGDAPLAPNYYRWCMSKRFLNMQPHAYPKQLQIGIKFYQDACPWCSDKDWYDEIPVDADVHEIPERLQLLRFGRCPSCHRTRLDAIRAGRSCDYEDMVVVAGQRSGKCISGNAIVKLATGQKRLRDVTEQDQVVVHGRTHAITKFWRRSKRPTNRLTSTMGYELVATPDHRIQTLEGWKSIAKATSIRLETDGVAFPSERDYLINKTNGRLAALEKESAYKPRVLLDIFLLLPRDRYIKRIKSLVCEEYISTTALHLEFTNSSVAIVIQHVLLGLGVICSRKDKFLSIEHPWARRYMARVGIKSRRIAIATHLATRQTNPYVHLHVSALLARWAMKVFPDEASMQQPAVMQDWAEVTQKMQARTFRYSDVTKTINCLKKLRVPDALYSNFVISVLRDVVNPNIVWDSVASCVRSSPEEVFDIEVPGPMAFVANGLVVHNSTSIGLLASYQTHQLLKLKNPSAFYGIKQGTILYSTIVGLTYSGAKTNVWDPLLATIQDSPWYSTYHSILNQAAAERGEEELARVKDTYIYYRNAGLYMAPASPSRRTLRGKTRIMSTVDELAHFSSNNKLVNISGIEVWNALTRSMQTVRLGHYKLRKKGVVNVPPAACFAISSPYEVTDPIMTLYNKPTSKTYALLSPTWEFNPDMTFEFLQPEFDRDAVTAWRDFGCRPPYSAASFVADIEPYNNVIDRKLVPACIQQTYVTSAKGKRKMTSAKITKWNWTDTNVKKILAIDAGSTYNAFSIVLAHMNAQNRVVYDTFIEIHPTPGRPISFTRVYEDLLLPLIEKMNVGVLISDRWQNKKIHDDVEAYTNASVVEHKLTYGELTAWREDLLEGRLVLPRPELKKKEILYPEKELATFIDKPVASFIYESIRVVDVPGKRVEKPSEGSDDVWRAGVLAHAGLHLDDVKELLKPGNTDKRTASAIGAIGSMVRTNATFASTGVAARASSTEITRRGAPGLVRVGATGSRRY